jgi:hypothetical protein
VPRIDVKYYDTIPVEIDFGDDDCCMLFFHPREWQGLVNADQYGYVPCESGGRPPWNWDGCPDPYHWDGSSEWFLCHKWDRQWPFPAQFVKMTASTFCTRVDDGEGHCHYDVTLTLSVWRDSADQDQCEAQYTSCCNENSSCVCDRYRACFKNRTLDAFCAPTPGEYVLPCQDAGDATVTVTLFPPAGA